MKLIQKFRRLRRILASKILDIDCSYDINAALLKCDVTMDELYERYCGLDARAQTRSTLLARNRELVRSRNRLKRTRFVGLDISRSALSYAHLAGFLDGVVHADPEERDPMEQQREQFVGTDFVASTGCLGYVSDRTISRVVSASEERKPWRAHFVLRMFPPPAVGVYSVDLEADGWLCAQLYIFRPRGTKGCAVVDVASNKKSSRSPNRRG
jgi:hypothetical protein